MIKAIVKALVALNSNVKKEQVAAGFACGFLLALVPAGNLLWLALFILSFFLKINYGMLLAATVLVKLLRVASAPALDAVGWAVLNIEALRPAYTALYNVPIAPLTRFNNTLVAGGLVVGAAFWLPLFFAMRAFVSVYRAKIAPKIAESKAYKAFLKLPLVRTVAGAVSSATRFAGSLD
jgi:uncharacterized protein (TIGR03546 family)